MLNRIIRQIRQQGKLGSIAQFPGSTKRPLREHGEARLATRGLVQAIGNLLPPNSQQVLVELGPSLMLIFLQRGPIQFGSFEGFFGVRIRNLLAHGRIAEACKERKFVAPSLGYCFRQITREIAKKQKWCVGRKLLSHEEQGRRRGKEQDRHCSLQGALIRQCQDSVAKGTVAYLVVVLKK